MEIEADDCVRQRLAEVCEGGADGVEEQAAAWAALQRAGAVVRLTGDGGEVRVSSAEWGRRVRVADGVVGPSSKVDLQVGAVTCRAEMRCGPRAARARARAALTARACAARADGQGGRWWPTC